MKRFVYSIILTAITSCYYIKEIKQSNFIKLPISNKIVDSLFCQFFDSLIYWENRGLDYSFKTAYIVIDHENLDLGSLTYRLGGYTRTNYPKTPAQNLDYLLKRTNRRLFICNGKYSIPMLYSMDGTFLKKREYNNNYIPGRIIIDVRLDTISANFGYSKLVLLKDSLGFEEKSERLFVRKNNKWILIHDKVKIQK